MAEPQGQKTGYQLYKHRLKQQLVNPKPPESSEYIRLSENGKKQYMKYVRKSYEMMFFWIGFGGLTSYISYQACSKFSLIRNRPSFKTIRIVLTVLPALMFPYHGIKFMLYYKRRGAREVAKDPLNIVTEQEYQKMIEEQSKVQVI